MTESEWVSRIGVVFHRVVPGSGKISGMSNAGIGGVITFGGDQPKLKLPTLTKFSDPYHSITKGVADTEGLAILGGDEKIPKLLTYDATVPHSHSKHISIWDIYKVRQTKELVASYIGCPMSHMTLFDEKGKNLGLQYSNAGETIPIDVIVSSRSLPMKVYIFLLGDWISTTASDVKGSPRNTSGAAASGSLWPEVDNPNEAWISSMTEGNRKEVLSTFYRREVVLSKLKDMKHTLHGKVTQSSLDIYPLTGRSVLSTKRLFYMLSLDPNPRPRKGQLVALAFNDGNTSRAKLLKGTTIKPTHISPNVPNQLKALTLIGEGDELHAYQISLLDDFNLSIIANWAGEHDKSRKELQTKSLGAASDFLDRIYSRFEEDVTAPGSHLPDRASLTSMLSIHAYQEEYTFKGKGGGFSEFKDIVSKLAQAAILKITYHTATSIYYQLQQGASRERHLGVYRYLSNRMRTKNFAAVWTAGDISRDFIGFLSRGPEIMVKSEESDLFIMISMCSGEEEIKFSSSICGKIASLCGYAPQGSKGEGRVRDYANLNLLEQIDPIQFGSRELPGGKKVNYSRECQSAARHPVPISLSQALASPSERTAIVNNLTYGGPQAYTCRDKVYKSLSVRPASFSDKCIMCCNQGEVAPGSLKWSEQNWCMSQMLFYGLSDSDAVIRPPKAHLGKPLKFDGQYLSEGRFAYLPSGVRETFSTKALIHHPLNVNIIDLHQVVEWVTGIMIEPFEGKITIDDRHGDPLEEEIMDYVMMGIPVAMVRIIPASNKSWRASLLDVRGFYDESPYIIVAWALDASSPPIAYYPITNGDGIPITSDDIGIPIDILGETQRGSKIPFTLEVIQNIGYEVKGMLLREKRCYGVMITYSKGKGKVKTAKAAKNNTFFLPIRPVKARIVNPLTPSDLKFPTVVELDTFLNRAIEHIPYYSPSAKTLITTSMTPSKMKYQGMVLLPDGVVVYFQPADRIPRRIDTGDAIIRAVSKDLMDVLWGRSVAMSIVPPKLISPKFSKHVLKSAEIYLSAKMVRYGIVGALATLLEHDSDLGKVHALIEKKCMKFVSFGESTNIPTHSGTPDGIILFGSKMVIPKALYRIITKRLAVVAKKNRKFLCQYFTCFGSDMVPERPYLAIWEKIVS